VKREKMIWLMIAAVVAVGIVFAVSWQGHSQETLLAQLHSTDWRKRAAAVEKLIAHGVAKSEEVKKALIDLLDRENRLIEATWRESGGQEGVAVKYGEGYSEYYAKLLGIVDKMADFSDKRTVKVLVRSAYNPDSPFAMKLVDHGEAIAPPLLELVSSDVAAIRANAIALLGEVLRRDKHRLRRMPAKMYEQIKQVLIRGTIDEDTGVRILAVRALGKVGDRDVIDVLERVARSDPAHIPTAGGGAYYPVREAAVQALQRLRPK